MDIEYNLHLGQFHVLPDHAGLNDVVLAIEYTYTGSVTIDGKYYSHAVTKAVTLLNDDSLDNSDFINFEDITKEMAEEWVMSRLSEEEIELMKAFIAAQINDQSSAPLVRTAPWIKTTN